MFSACKCSIAWSLVLGFSVSTHCALAGDAPSLAATTVITSDFDGFEIGTPLCWFDDRQLDAAVEDALLKAGFPKTAVASEEERGAPSFKVSAMTSPPREIGGDVACYVVHHAEVAIDSEDTQSTEAKGADRIVWLSPPLPHSRIGTDAPSKELHHSTLEAIDMAARPFVADWRKAHGQPAEN